MVMADLDSGPIPDTLLHKDDTVGLKVQDMEVVLNRSTTIPCSMLEKLLMELIEVYLDLGPSLLSTIIEVIMIDHLVLIVMAIAEVGIGLTPEYFLHITMEE